LYAWLPWLNFPARIALTYLCGYLVKKCLDKHNCDIRIDYTQSQNRLNESFLFTHFKVYQNENRSTYGNLNTLPNIFAHYINDLDCIFIDEFSINAVKDNIGK